MSSRSVHLPLWSGLLLAIAALIGYPTILARFPVTRDVPWVSLLLLAISAVLAFLGLRRAFSGGSSRGNKIAASVVSTLTVLVIAVFILGFMVAPRRMPASHGAPQVGQKAPEFRLADTSGQPVALSELLAAPSVAGKPPKGVLLVFYRGYW